METGVYTARPIKRLRRTNAEIAIIKTAIYATCEAYQPITLRGLFYRLVSQGVIEKTEREYDKVGYYLLQMRRAGDLPYLWITDSTRWMRKPRTHSGIGAALDYTARTYRRPIWDDQDTYVEVWCEKDTLAGILTDETAVWDVPLMVCRGFSSETYLHEAAGTIEEIGKPTWLYLLTDHDPSGLGIAAHVERIIRGFLPDGFPVTVERLAVTPDQIETWQLPTRPTKASDSRAKTFEGESVELDAIAPDQLRELVRNAIEQHISPTTLALTKRVEQLERNTFLHIQENWSRWI